MLSRKVLMALNDIDDNLIIKAELSDSENEMKNNLKMQRKKKRYVSSGFRKPAVLVAVIAAVLAFAAVAFATDIFGIKDIWPNLTENKRELQQEAVELIETQEMSAEAELCGEKIKYTLNESLCTENNVMVALSALSENCILIPSDATPEDSTKWIGLDGGKTIQQYADENEKKIVILDMKLSGDLSECNFSLSFENISPSEMVILYSAETSGFESTEAEAEIISTMIKEDGKRETVKTMLPVALHNDGGMIEREFLPEELIPVEGIIPGNVKTRSTALGTSIYLEYEILDIDKESKIKKIECASLGGSQGGAFGNGKAEILNAEGDIGDKFVIDFYDFDNNVIGSTIYEEKGF